MATKSKQKSIEVLVDEVTALRTVNELPQQDGSVRYQNGMGQTFLLGEVIPADQFAKNWYEALENGDEDDPLYQSLSKKFKLVSDDPSEDAARRLGLPFDGFDDMELDEIVAAMRVLPSATVQRIKEYESKRDEPRTEITDYVIGFGEHPDERQLRELEVDDVDEEKAVRRLKTRKVPDDGPVEFGEGVTGGATHGVQKPYGVEADVEDGDKDAPKKANLRGAAKKAAERRGRRDRQPKPDAGTSKTTDKSIGKTNAGVDES